MQPPHRLHDRRLRCFGYVPNKETIDANSMSISANQRNNSGNTSVSVLKRIDEAQRSFLAGFTGIVIDRLFNIPLGSFARDDPLAAHAGLRGSARSRNLSK